MKLFHSVIGIGLLAGFSRILIAIVGLMQIHLVIDGHGVVAYGKLAAVFALLPIGTIIEGGLSWGLRFKIAAISSSDEIRSLTTYYFKRYIWTISILITPILIILPFTHNDFARACGVIIILSLLSVVFVPWIRCMEGISKQKNIMFFQVIASLLIFCILFLFVTKLNINLISALLTSTSLLTGLAAFFYVLRADKLLDSLAPSINNEPTKVWSNKISNLESLIIAFTSAILFSSHPLFLYMGVGSASSASSGIQVRLLSLYLGIIGILSTQLQVHYIRDRTYLSHSATVGRKLFLLPLFGFISYLIGISFTNFLLFPNSSLNITSNDFSYAVLVALSVFQIFYSAIDAVMHGLRFQAKQLAFTCFLVVSTWLFISPTRSHLVWVIDFYYGLFFVFPIWKRRKGTNEIDSRSHDLS